MGKLWTVIRREYVERVRSKWFVIVTLFGPLFFGTVMVSTPSLKAAVTFSGSTPPPRVKLRLKLP